MCLGRTGGPGRKGRHGHAGGEGGLTLCLAADINEVPDLMFGGPFPDRALAVAGVTQMQVPQLRHRKVSR